MNERQIELVQHSFTRVASSTLSSSTSFYYHLFETHPELRQLFTGDLHNQGVMLMKVLSMAVNSLYDMDALVPTLLELGERHKGYGVKAHHYDAVRDTLIWVLGQELGDDFTAEVEEAWNATFDALALCMMGSEDQNIPA